MAGAAVGRSAFENNPVGAGDVAADAGQAGMSAGQRENGPGVVKC